MSRYCFTLANVACLVLCICYVEFRLSDLRSPSTAPIPEQQIGLPDSVKPLRSGHVVIYNRIPKTGSTTLTNAIGYDLCKTNGFHAIHLNLTKNRYLMNAIDQGEFVRNVSEWTERLPAFYHGHVAFVDFSRYGYPNPIYINLVREPLERVLSYYYFLRYGDNYRVGLKRSKAGHNETFDECVASRGKDCDPKLFWLQIPYFCGTATFCSEPGNQQALDQAKFNLVNHYLVVGLNDRLSDLISVLERLVPRFFRGAYDHFLALDDNRSHLRYTNKKIPPSAETMRKIQAEPIYQMEKEFYNFVKTEFEALWKRVTNDTSTTDDVSAQKVKFVDQQFHYEKIKP